MSRKIVRAFALIAVLSLLNGAARADSDQTDASESRSGHYPPNYVNSHAGNYAGSGYQQQPGIRLVLDSSCKRYSCVPTTSPMAMCALVCSPDGRTPFCPIINCVSASGASCADFKCSVQTYAQQPYY